MLKLIYRVIILIAIFIISLSYFSRDIKEVVFNIDNTTTMEEATFPLVTIRVEGETINLLHGYSSNIDADKVRDSVIPLSNDKSFEVLIDEKDYDIKKLNYEVREFVGNTLIESGTVSVFDDEEDGISAGIKLKADLKQDKEYAVKITLITSESKKMYFYQRIKIYNNAYINDKIFFAMNFHKTIMDKANAESIIRYLEPSKDADNSSLAYVNIHSSFDLITWGTLKPVILTSIVPSVKEIYKDTALIELKYVAEVEIAGRIESFQIKEFYRIRYTSERMYLLNYERYMEAIFNTSLASVSKNELKLGITSDLDVPYAAGADKSKVAFIRNRELWFYDLTNNEITRVFSFRQENTDYIRDLYDQHDLRIINMDAEGNIHFLVYGYMNRGQYEGRVGMLLYRFIRAESRIEELAYIPVDEPYQLMKESIGELFYVNAKEIFFFQVFNDIYSYNLVTKKLSVIASDIDKKQVAVLKDLYCAVWQESGNITLSDNIFIMNLETGSMDTIPAPSGYSVLLLDKIDTNIIYGFVNKDYITTMIDGYVIAPVSSLEIASKDKKVLKRYSDNGYFISGINVNDNIIELKRVIKVAEDGRITYITAESDSIMNQRKNKTALVDVTLRVTDQALTEHYMTLPQNFVMKELPKVKTTINTVITQDPTVRIPEQETVKLLYYPFTVKDLEGAYEKAADAIKIAREGLGVVVNSEGKLIWERGVKASKAIIPGFDIIKFEAAANAAVEGSIKLILAYQGLNIPMDNLYTGNSSAYDVLQSYSKYSPIRLTGVTLDDALYYVSKGKPVMAMTSVNKAVVIYGYDAYNINVADPATGKKIKIGMQYGTELFETAGNIFISYLE